MSESVDRAADEADRLERLRQRWWEEAERYGVLPLDDRMGERVKANDPATDRLRYTMLPGTRILNHVVGPSFSERGFTITARVVCAPGEEGVILAYGRRAFGFSFFIKGRNLTVDYNLAGRHTLLTAPEELPTADTTVTMRVEPAPGGGRLSLVIDGRRAAEATVPRLIPGGIGTLSIQCGHNAPSPVSEAYEAPFTFSGALDRVIIELDERQRDKATTEAGIEGELAFQ
jgi:arylsulfatase